MARKKKKAQQVQRVKQMFLETFEVEGETYYQTHLLCGKQVFTLRYHPLAADKVAAGHGSANIVPATKEDAAAVRQAAKAGVDD